MTRFRGARSVNRTGPALRFHSYKPGPTGPARVRDFHPIPLSSEEQECVSDPLENRVAHLPRKPKNIEFYDNIITIIDPAVNTPRDTNSA